MALLGRLFGVVEAASHPGRKIQRSSVPVHSTGVPAEQPCELGTVTAPASQRREPRLGGLIAGHGHPAGKQQPGSKPGTRLSPAGPAVGSQGQASDPVCSGLRPCPSAD